MTYAWKVRSVERALRLADLPFRRRPRRPARICARVLLGMRDVPRYRQRWRAAELVGNDRDELDLAAGVGNGERLDEDASARGRITGERV